MSENEDRSLWGEQPRETTNKNTGSPFWQIVIALILGLVPAGIFRLLVDLLDFQIGMGGSPEELAASQLAITIFLVAITELVIVFSPIFPGSMNSRAGRVIRIFLAFLLVGVMLAAATYLLMSVLASGSTLEERLVLPVLVIVFFGIMAFFSPVMPIWVVNVPDNEVWMIFDQSDHLLKYVDTGIQTLRPLQGYQRYEEKGAVIITFDDETFVSSDAFPYRIRAKIVCLFNPLNADEKLWVMLRDMTRAQLENMIKTDIEFIIRNELKRYMRGNLRLDVVLNAISHKIQETVDARRHFGVRLAPLNPINISLDPPSIMLGARERRLSLEALATVSDEPNQQTLGDLMQLMAPGSDLKFQVSPDGQITFSLDPGNDIEIGDTLEKVITGAGDIFKDALNRMPRKNMLPEPERVAPPVITAGNDDDDDGEPPGGGAGGGFEDEDTQPVKPPNMPPAGSKQPQPKKTGTEVPKNPMAPHEDTREDDGYIDTDMDSQGVFIPRNPIGPKDQE